MRTMNMPHYLLEVELNREKVPSFTEYPFCLPAVSNLRCLQLHPAVTFLVGENGVGKSILLEAMAVGWGFNPEGGSRNSMFASRPSHSVLHEYLRLGRGLRRPKDGFFLRAERFYNLATHIEDLDREAEQAGGCGRPVVVAYGGRSLHEQSHGEAFLALFMDRFRGNGLYLLDEPEAALSPIRQMAVLTRMHQLVTQGSQFVIATHSPIILAYPNAEILLFTEQGIRPVRYQETDHYAVTRRFLDAPDEMLQILLEPEPDAGTEQTSRGADNA